MFTRVNGQKITSFLPFQDFFFQDFFLFFVFFSMKKCLSSFIVLFQHPFVLLMLVFYTLILTFCSWATSCLVLVNGKCNVLQDSSYSISFCQDFLYLQQTLENHELCLRLSQMPTLCTKYSKKTLTDFYYLFLNNVSMTFWLSYESYMNFIAFARSTFSQYRHGRCLRS